MVFSVVSMNTYIKKVSVIIPTYRRPDRLKRALASVIAQTYPNFEVLVVNDDSDQDAVRSVISEFGDERIRLFRNQRTKGGNGARNTGIIHSAGDYISFLDDDDVWKPERLSVLVRLLNETSDRQIVISAIEVIDKNAHCDIVYDCEYISLDDLLINRYGIGASSNFFVRKSFVDQVGLWNEALSRYQDLEYAIRVLLQTRIIYCKDVLLTVFGHNEPKLLNDIVENHKKYINSIAEYIEPCNRDVKKRFYAYQYRTVALALLRAGETTISFRYIFKSLRSKILIKTHVRVIFVYIDKIFGCNIEKILKYR